MALAKADTQAAAAVSKLRRDARDFVDFGIRADRTATHALP
jgi:hypothetical protein